MVSPQLYVFCLLAITWETTLPSYGLPGDIGAKRCSWLNSNHFPTYTQTDNLLLIRVLTLRHWMYGANWRCFVLFRGLNIFTFTIWLPSFLSYAVYNVSKFLAMCCTGVNTLVTIWLPSVLWNAAEKFGKIREKRRPSSPSPTTKSKKKKK